MLITAALAVQRGAQFELAEIDLDTPRDDEILVRVVATGVCHTDIGRLDDLDPAWTPMVLGHETAGVVELVGRSIVGVRPGDHVVLTFRHCRECYQCLVGVPELLQGLPGPELPRDAVSTAQQSIGRAGRQFTGRTSDSPGSPAMSLRTRTTPSSSART